ncbi:hypothetical protein RRG08_002488 [Elysia crispata]|uniref:Uncharacterized protein n=1 Tax=Elysia crispata TaxID=231223 RepID=A0AAE1A7R1_9GAST|nr:hypothetical protein RRG08_002488 [Elysia crispata]
MMLSRFCFVTFCAFLLFGPKGAWGQTCKTKGDRCHLCGRRCCAGLQCLPASPFPDVDTMYFCTDDNTQQCVQKGWSCSSTLLASICCQGLRCDNSYPNNIFPRCKECPKD